MSRIKRTRPSPAIVIAVLALVAALAGTAFAGPGPGATDAAQHKLTSAQKKQVNKIAKKKGKKEAKKLDKKFLPIEAENLADGAVEASKLGSIEVRTSSTTILDANIAATTASCQTGEKVLGGGGRFDNGPIAAEHTATQLNYPTDNGWRAGGVNDSGVDQPYTAYAVCLKDNGNG